MIYGFLYCVKTYILNVWVIRHNSILITKHKSIRKMKNIKWCLKTTSRYLTFWSCRCPVTIYMCIDCNSIFSLFQSFADTEKGKIVMYVTTLGVVRDHLARCQKVRHILRTLLIRVEERDIFMCKRHQVELRDRINAAKGLKSISSNSSSSMNIKTGKFAKSQSHGDNEERLEVPQLFVEGQYFGVRYVVILFW